MLLKKQWVNDEIKEEIRKYLETNNNENTSLQNRMGCSKSSSKREFIAITGLPQETRTITNTQPNLPLKRIRKRTNKTQSQQKEGNDTD